MTPRLYRVIAREGEWRYVLLASRELFSNDVGDIGEFQGKMFQSQLKFTRMTSSQYDKIVRVEWN